MAGYLEDYGVEEARRGRLIKRIVISVVVLAVVGGIAHFSLRSYSAKRQVDNFLLALRNKDYQTAYRMWGCTENSPCRDYTFDKFMEDWGPKGQHPEAGSAEIKKTR